MPAQEAIAERLRSAASDGLGVCSLVEIVKREMGSDVSSFSVMHLLIESLGLSLADIRELPGARCLGGAVYEDAEIERLLDPAIRKALGKES